MSVQDKVYQRLLERVSNNHFDGWILSPSCVTFCFCLVSKKPRSSMNCLQILQVIYITGGHLFKSYPFFSNQLKCHLLSKPSLFSHPQLQITSHPLKILSPLFLPLITYDFVKVTYGQVLLLDNKQLS